MGCYLQFPRMATMVERCASVVEIEKEDANGIKGVKAYTWKSVLPYKLTFTMRLTGKEPMRRLKGIAFGVSRFVG